MVDLDELSSSDKTIAGCGIVLVVDLLFLPWHSIDLGIATSTRSGVEPPGQVWGALAVLLTAAVVAVTLLRALKPDRALPELAVPWDAAVLAGAASTLALLVVKLAMDTGSLGIGAWLGILLAGAMTWGAALGRGSDVAE